jgi:hypothetical protein
MRSSVTPKSRPVLERMNSTEWWVSGPVRVSVYAGLV